MSEPGAVRKTDPETSHEAAASVDATSLESLVLRALGNHPEGLTAGELCEITGLTQNSLTPRTAPLCRKGFIYDSGEKRIGPSGRRMIVWKKTSNKST